MLGSKVHSFTVGATAGPFTLGYNTGQAGDFSTWYLGSLSGFAITEGAVEFTTNVTEIHYSITAPAP